MTLRTAVTFGVLATATATQVDHLTGAVDWATATLEGIRQGQEVRQQDIQNTVCELNGTAPGDCPKITLTATTGGTR